MHYFHTCIIYGSIWQCSKNTTLYLCSVSSEIKTNIQDGVYSSSNSLYLVYMKYSDWLRFMLVLCFSLIYMHKFPFFQLFQVSHQTPLSFKIPNQHMLFPYFLLQQINIQFHSFACFANLLKNKYVLLRHPSPDLVL